MLPTIAISLGHPGGIGPEVTVKSLADPALRAAARYILIGADAPLRAAASLARIQPFWTSNTTDWPHTNNALLLTSHLNPTAPSFPPTDSALQGQLSLDWFEHAIRLAQLPPSHAHHAHAIVTAPISKASWSLAGEHKHHGHTGLLAARCGSLPHAMMFASPILNVALVTDHIPLAQVPAHLTAPSILQTITLAARAMQRLGTPSPRIAVCGLNPHAGENSTIGDEDARTITPAIHQARAQSIDAHGPFPADTIFRRALLNRAHDFDLVIAMYHDQGLIPLKLLAMEHAVNLTIGLPIIRTSPDHGTALDIAGHNKADPSSMHAAISLAIKMASRTPVPSKL